VNQLHYAERPLPQNKAQRKPSCIQEQFGCKKVCESVFGKASERSKLARSLSLLKAEDDTGRQANAVLYVGCAVGKLCPQPLCLNRTDSEVT
jgi:hypothetical protein